MFPHHKLDWHLGRLDKRLASNPDDTGARTEYARACLSRALWHGGGEVWLNRALTQARRLLQFDPASPAANAVAGAALVALGRIEPGARYLDEALRLAPDRADVHLGLSELHRAQGDLHQAVREAEVACRLAPESWEAHHLLSRVLWERYQQLGGRGRLAERSQYHAVRALRLGATGPVEAPLRYQLAIACMHTGRFADAHKLFLKLLDDDAFRDRAEYYLGLVAYQMGKPKNAVMYLRRHLARVPDNPRVLARLGLCHLQLGQVDKAREACNRALALDPTDVQARWTLGCALVEEGHEDEAIRTFKGILHDHPDHAPAFDELVRIRSAHGDVNWLHQALQTEVARYERLPHTAEGSGPRQATRARIASVLRALGAAPVNALPAVLAALTVTGDEALRFQLWEAACDHVAGRKAREAAVSLQSPGTSYSAEEGQQVLALADRLPEPLLTRGLAIDDDDLRRAAVDRHGPAHDVTRHRKRIDDERRQARAWQAQLLLAIGARQNQASASLLRRWAAEADDDLADAARAALVLLGDDEATRTLRRRARARGAAGLMDALLTHVDPPRKRFQPRPADPDADAVCATCGRRAAETGHLLQGANAAVCDGCTTELARDRRHLLTDDPAVRCALCDRNNLEAHAVYVYRAVPVCAECLGHSLGMSEREEVDAWLAALA